MELDRRTIKRLQNNDRAAQDAFLRRYTAILHAFVRRAGPGGDVDDLTQELLEKLLTVVHRFEPDGSAQLTTWVFTVAHRWLLDEKKRRHVQLVELDDAVHLADGSPAADQFVLNRQLETALERALLQLPEAQRRVFVLAYVHEQPLAIVAEVEGVPVGTIKSRLHHARSTLATALRPILFPPARLGEP